LESKIRRRLIYLLEWKWFDRIAIFFVIFNSCILGAYDFAWDGSYNKPTGNIIADETEPLFTIVFILEFLVKLVATGVIMDEKCYLCDIWNCIDFTVVLASVVMLLSNVQNLTFLRTFRLFRPLRTLKAIPSMKILVNTLLNSLT
jgi:hypothetical protein